MWGGTRALAVVLLLAVAVLSGGCTEDRGSEPQDPVAGVQLEAPVWQPCGQHGAECATLPVPLDWAAPDGERITLALTRQRARKPEQRIGPLFFNPGGPGGAPVLGVRDFPHVVFPDDLRDRFDLIGLDPRGVGESRPAITCPVPPVSQQVTQFPATTAEFEALSAYNRNVGIECRKATGPLLEHVDSISAARDIEAVRRVLGEEQLSWLGLSYGTLLGATFAQLYPERIRAAVLDGPVDHAVTAGQFFLDETRSAEDSFAGFAEWCRTDTTCPLQGRDIRADYRELLDRAARQPVPAEDDPDGVTAEQIGMGTYAMLTVRAEWPGLAGAIAAAIAPTPDAAALGALTAAGSDKAAYRAIMCHDFPSDIRDFADFTARLSTARGDAPTTRGYVEGADVQAGCLGWPIVAANPTGPVEVRGAAPIMIVAGAHDPATPQQWGAAMARQIQDSFVVTWEGFGHTAYHNDPATTRREIAYLIDPTTKP